jgi:hypothetical protein
VLAVDFLDRSHFERGVRVEAALDPGYVVREGSVARTTAPGFGMGRPPIEIIAGAEPGAALPSGSTIQGMLARAVESLFPPEIVNTVNKAAVQIGDAADALRPALVEATELLKRRTPGEVDSGVIAEGNLSSAVARLDSALRHFNAVLGEPEVRSHLKEGIANFHQISVDGAAAVADLKAASADARAAVEEYRKLATQGGQTLVGVDEKVDELARAGVESLDKIDSLVAALHELVDGVNRGEGTIGKLFADDRLHEALVLTFARLAELTQEFTLLVKDWQQGKVRVGF